MALNEILEVYPSLETLNSSVKGRPKLSTQKNIKRNYHCPIQTCKYYKKEFYFDKIKFLKQHFVKVHKTRSFSCNKCGKSFPLQSTLNHHKSICGIIYRCHCKLQYNTYEAFLTHTKRKHHGSPLKYKDMMVCLKVHKTAQSVQKHFDNSLKVHAIFVEDTSQQKLLYLKKKKQFNDASSKETQTKMCQILPKISAHTQTSVSIQTSTDNNTKRRKKCKTPLKISTINDLNEKNLSTSCTQTTPLKDDKLLSRKNLKACDDILELNVINNDFRRTNHNKLLSNFKNLNQKTVKHELNLDSPIVQSMNFEDTSDNSNSSTSFSFNDKKMMFANDPNLGSLPCLNVWEDNAFGTSETQTNNTELFLNEIMKTDPNLIMYSDSETQTMFEDCFNNSCTNTYTQTCEPLFSDLNFVDIQTQTSWSIFDDTNISCVT